MPGQASNTKQVSRLGETPAEARARMQSSGGGAAPEAETAAPLSEPTAAQHMAAMREQEGFGGGPSDDAEATVEETVDQTAPPSPEKAMDTIRQLSQEKIQLITERDAACALVERYRAIHGDLD